MKCPKCHFDNPSDSKFCKECGTQIGGHEPKSPEFGIVSPGSKTETMQAPIQELTTGSTFANRYQIIEELGKGGMGKVYKVFDQEVQAKMALKLIRPEVSADKNTIDRFRNELKIARDISHNNICRMYDLGREAGNYFITMEYVSGEDLKSFIRRSRQLVVGTAIFIARQVCEGLAEAHRLGVVHRDLKPGNIMIDRDGNAKIMDFGIARSLSVKGITGAGVMIGTPEYMSPEQVEGKEVDQRSDIYSLGIILYEMLTGQVPFEGDTPFTIGVKQKSEIPRDPKELNALIPQDLSRLILKCLEKEKERRYQRVDEILSALAAIESGTSATGITVAKVPDTDKMLERTWKKSIAVLPFSNLSPDREQEYFCDGLSEEIINALSHVRELRVVARTSAFAFKGKEIDIREVGEKLNVDAVLEGSVRKAGDRLRITAQLINVVDGYHLWSERFDREMKDVFNIQDEVTLEIMDKLKIELLGKEREQVVKRYTDNLEAHNLLLKGWYFWARRTQEGLKKSMEYIRQAIEMDPAYALAQAHLAMNLISLPVMGFARPHDAYPKAKAAAQRALEIDGSLPKAHAALAWVSHFYDWDWTAAEKGFKKALSLNPGLDYAYFGLAWHSISRGRIEEGILAQKKAVELDPLSLWMNADLGHLLIIARRFDEAQEQLRKTNEMDPNFSYPHLYMGVLYYEKGMYREAIGELQKAIELIGGLSWAYWTLGGAYARLGQEDETIKILHVLEERFKKEYPRSFVLAGLYQALGNIDKSFEFLEKALEEREPLLSLIKVMPGNDLLRPDPRFHALLKKMNLDK